MKYLARTSGFFILCCLVMFMTHSTHAQITSGVTGPQTFTDPTPGTSDDYNAAKFFLQSGSSFRGDLLLSGSNFVEVLGIDLSGLSGAGASSSTPFARFGLQNSGGFGFQTLGVQVIRDHFGAGGHLLQSVEFGGSAPFTVQSSHGFNPGDVTGKFDMRFDFFQSTAGGTWDVTPSFRLAGQTGFTTFFDGPWTSINSYDITEGLVAVDIGSTSGSMTVDNIIVNPEPGTIVLLGAGLLGLGVIARRRRQ